MRAWGRDWSLRSLDELMQLGVPVEDALTEAGVGVQLGCRLLQVTQRCHVDEGRRQAWSEHEFAVEAEVEGWSSYPAIPPRSRLVILLRCKSIVRTGAPCGARRF